MLVTREEMAFDFQGARLDPVKDRDVIVWAVQQFLYGEITGVQIGHWLYNAPDLESARFLARQAVEEFQHVGNFLRILEILGAPPDKAAWSVRFLATGLMGGDWAEHVALEMALGEGLVLQAFYAMIETVDEPEIVAILKRGVRQEERHVDFGEQQTRKAIAGRPALRRRLLGLALVSLWGVSRLEAFMKKRLPMDHPALKRLPDLVRHTVRIAELRLMRIGLTEAPISSMSSGRKLALVAEAYGGKLALGLASWVLSVLLFPLRLLGLAGPKRLTDTYLSDPLVARGGRLGAGAEAGAEAGTEDDPGGAGEQASPGGGQAGHGAAARA
ncbi:ferritin-like domain-containing protein [Sorangium sp. So ce302]|uniref:ferritin-like domain-containing protein n=1 Tax=Sorangium sp. So ce302 TaxID=3133297 RepID=UPI003F620C89